MDADILLLLSTMPVDRVEELYRGKRRLVRQPEVLFMSSRDTGSSAAREIVSMATLIHGRHEASAPRTVQEPRAERHCHHQR